MQRRIGKGLGFEDIDLRIYDVFIKKRETIKGKEIYIIYTHVRESDVNFVNIVNIVNTANTF